MYDIHYIISSHKKSWGGIGDLVFVKNVKKFLDKENNKYLGLQVLQDHSLKP